MDRRQSLFEIIFISAAIVYFGVRFSVCDSIEEIEADVLRPIELAQTEGMRERSEKMSDDALVAENEELVEMPLRSLASIADAATSVHLYASPLLSESTVALAKDLDRHVIRRRGVTPNLHLMKEKIANLETENIAELSEDYRSLSLNLFPDAQYSGVVDRVERSLNDGYILHGHVQGERESSMDMVYENETLIADISVGRDRFELRFMQDTHIAQQVDPSRVDVFTNLDETQILSAVIRDGSGSITHEIPLNIVYSAPTKIIHGSRASVEGSVQLAVVRANQQLIRSGSSAQIRIASLQEGEVSKGGFQVSSASFSQAKSDGCGLELVQNEETIWNAGDMVEILWRGDNAASQVELVLIAPNGSEQTLGTTDNDGQAHILVPKAEGFVADEGFRLRLKTPDGCAVESRFIQIH